MSQITRCPSCATSFKVVADQLRISQGWVRCGQCKEVFDASAHLVFPAAPVVAPGVVPDWASSFAKEHALADAADRSAETEHAAFSPQDDAVTAPMSSLKPAEHFSEGSTSWARHAEFILPGDAVPVPSTADVGGGPAIERISQSPGEFYAGQEIDLEAPLASRGLLNATGATGISDAAFTAESAHQGPVRALRAAVTQPARSESVLAPWLRGRGDAQPLSGDPLDAPWQDPVTAQSSAVTPVVGAVIEQAEPSEPSPAVWRSALPEDNALTSLAVDVALPESRDNLLLQEETDSLDQAIDLAPGDLTQGNVPLAVARDELLKAPAPQVADGALEDEIFLNPNQEVGFVVAARHKALWRRPVVRAMLSLVLLLSILGLTLQIAVHERDHIAAMDARTKPFLMTLCGAFGCDVAPQRQIAQVVIDSSSFNKARGDSYQLVFVMKNRAGAPVAMPALELTLTDTQDQPVLRKVLLPSDLTAPTELAARGEWDASVSVVVTTGGARVAGYRLLAFYP